MPLSSIGVAGVHNVGRGVLWNCGVYSGSNPSLFGIFLTFCGLAYFITRADILLRVRIFYYACGCFIKGAEVVGSASGRES